MSGTIKITLVKSMVGRPEKHRKVLRGMGLNKLNRTVELENTPSIRGMINKVSHLVKIEVEVSNPSELEEALTSGVDVIMLDNMNIEQIRAAVTVIDGKALVEVLR